jgi:outer membrane protein assembly factor BamB
MRLRVRRRWFNRRRNEEARDTESPALFSDVPSSRSFAGDVSRETSPKQHPPTSHKPAPFRFMFHVKRRRRIFTALALAAIPLIAACTSTTGSTGWAPPIPDIDDENVVIIRNDDKKISAIDLKDQTELWRFPGEDDVFPGLADSIEFKAFYGVPVPLGTDPEEFVVAGEEGGVVYAVRYDGSSARLLFDTEDSIIAGLVVEGLTIYVATTDKNLYAINADVPETITWQFQAFGGALWGTPALVQTEAFGQLLLVPAMDGHIYAIRTDPTLAESERLAWEFSGTNGSIAANVHVEDGVAYFGSFDRHFYAVDIETGAEKWSANGDNWFWSSPLIVGDILYAGDLEGSVWAWNKTTGNAAWQAPYPAEDEVRSRPVLVNDGDTLLVIAKSGVVHAIDPVTGLNQWTTVPIDDDVLADTLIVAGRVLVSNDDGDLFEVLFDLDIPTVLPIFPPLIRRTEQTPPGEPRSN